MQKGFFGPEHLGEETVNFLLSSAGGTVNCWCSEVMLKLGLRWVVCLSVL